MSVTPDNPSGLAQMANRTYCGCVCDTCNARVHHGETAYCLAAWSKYQNTWRLAWLWCKQCWNGENRLRREHIEEKGSEVLEIQYGKNEQEIREPYRITQEDLDRFG